MSDESWIEQWMEPLRTQTDAEVSVDSWRQYVRNSLGSLPAGASIEAQEEWIADRITARGLATDGNLTPRMIARDELRRIGRRQ